jgi:mono/diheme cytochrome c family protein
MKKALKIVGAGLALVVVLVGAFALYVKSDWPVHKKVEKVDLQVDATPERLARGKLLVSIRCAGCHYDQKTGALTGQRMHDAPPEFGVIYSHNITKHPTKGLGRYTDGELLYLLRTGIRRDGVFSGPFMESPTLGDEDLYSIIAFLRSDDPWVAAKDVDDRNWEPTFLAKMLMHVAFKPMAMPKAKIVVPDLKDQVAYGRYVINSLGDCYACHSGDFKTLNAPEPEKSGGYLGGGNETRDANGIVVRTANLTMDPETGIGKWSEDDFVRAVRTGIRKDGRALRFPMVAYPELSEAEVKAAFAYLKTVPPMRHAVERNFDQPAQLVASASDGEKLYHKYACFSCHGADGVGICDLREASKKYDSDDKLSAFLHDASKFVTNTKMPTWNGTIAEPEYPALIAYIHSLESKYASAKP